MAKRHEEWLQEVYDRQRNTAFPDTAANEARFWRHLFNGTRTLSSVQIACVLVLAVAVLAIVVATFAEDDSGSFLGNVLVALVRWALAFGILAGFLIVFGLVRRLEARRALKIKTGAGRHPENTSDHAS